MTGVRPLMDVLDGLSAYFGWERAMDNPPELREEYHDGQLPDARLRRLGSTLLLYPERASNVVVRTIAGCVVVPGLSEAERAGISRLVQHVQARRLPTPTQDSTVLLRLAEAGCRFLVEEDVEAFVTMMRMHVVLGGGTDARTRSKHFSEWIERVARPKHGDSTAVLTQLSELVATIPAATGRAVTVALSDAGEFGEVWLTNTARDLLKCIMIASEAVVARRVMTVRVKPAPGYRSRLAVEYLTEYVLVYGAFASTYEDMIKRIEYQMDDEEWWHEV